MYSGVRNASFRKHPYQSPFLINPGRNDRTSSLHWVLPPPSFFMEIFPHAFTLLGVLSRWPLVRAGLSCCANANHPSPAFSCLFSHLQLQLREQNGASKLPAELEWFIKIKIPTILMG